MPTAAPPEWASDAYRDLIRAEGLLAEGSRYLHYQGAVVPGLLQTARYALLSFNSAAKRFTGAEQDQSIQLKRKRQSTVLDGAAECIFLLDEAVARHIVGGRSVMAQQLAHIVERAERPNVTIRMVPFSAGLYVGIGFPYILLVSPSGDEHFYREHPMGDIYGARPMMTPEGVSPMEVFVKACQSALSPADSIAFISKIASAMAADA